MKKIEFNNLFKLQTNIMYEYGITQTNDSTVLVSSWKYNKAKIWIYVVLLLIVQPFQLLSQSNPGYLGKTQLVEVNVLTEWGRVINFNPTVVTSYGLSYEFARNKNFGILLGFRTSNQKRFADGFEPSFYIESIDNYVGPKEADLSNGRDMDYLSYTNNELYVQFKKYNTTKGALAPFGSYWGLELSGSQLSSKDNRLRYQQYVWPNGLEEIPVVKSNRTVLAFIPSVIFGNRQMLTDEISLNVYMGIGTILFHNSSNMTIYDEYVDSEKELVDYMMLRPVAVSRLINVGFNLGYFF